MGTATCSTPGTKIQCPGYEVAIKQHHSLSSCNDASTCPALTHTSKTHILVHRNTNTRAFEVSMHHRFSDRGKPSNALGTPH
mmetsp:Transcript_22565/g.57584  ORF Transcript_22565/g.57584 Transcript_22565/m.57584 type:complete len:82 (-) Transcript_22565:702-947(-)